MRELRAGVAAAVLFSGIGFGIVATGTARAADDGYANVFWSLGNAAGLIKEDAAPDIDYRERAPLVIPPQPGLPAPQAGIKRAAAWPQDADVVARRKAAEPGRVAGQAGQRIDGQVLTGAELASGRGAGEPVRPNECGNNGNNSTCLYLSPAELKRQGEAYEAANPGGKSEVVAGKEPDRVYLTQPPKGYMKAARTMKATSEAPEQKLDESSAYRIFDKPKSADE